MGHVRPDGRILFIHEFELLTIYILLYNIHMTKSQDKIKAIALRKEGHSYARISAQLGVSKGTLCVWLAGVPYTPNEETLRRIGKARAASSAAKSKILSDSLHLAHIEARRDVGKISDRDLFMLGLGIYIGEGTKSIYTPCVVNADPVVIQSAIQWFMRVLGVPRNNFRMVLHIYPDIDEDESLLFWSKTTTIPVSQFLKTQVDMRRNKRRVNRGKLPHGTVHLRVLGLGDKRLGSFLARKIKAWTDISLEQVTAGLV